MVDRVSTYNIFQTSLSSTGRVFAQLADLQNQLSSGYRAQNFAGIPNEATQYLKLEDTLARTQRYLDNNSLVKVRLQTTDTVLTQVIDTATELKNLILLRRNDSLSVGDLFATQLDDAWRTLTSQLNTSVSGRYVFGGASIDTPPVDTESFPVLAVQGTPDDGYYRGDNVTLTARVDDNVTINYNVRANASGLQKIFAGLSMAKLGDEQGSDAYLAQSFDLIKEGIEEVNSLQAQVRSNTLTVDNINANLTSLRIYWTGVQEETIRTDFVSVSTQVAINEGILQASFQSFARITSLRLSDFLR